MNSLPRLSRRTCAIPTHYPERIVQFGAGNFLRAFVDWIIEVLNEQQHFASSVVVVKVTPHDTYQELDEQDGLFHVITQGIQNGQYISDTRLITCINRTVYPYLDYASYLALARQPEIRFLISNTTEAGIRYDAHDQSDDQPPASFPAKLTLFLYTRYLHFAGAADKGCIILPTELIEQNGTQLRDIILRYAHEWQLESGFTCWLTEHNLFCNTLVDRIVSGYPTEQAAALHQILGFEDKLLVIGEPYLSWFIEAPPNLELEFPVTRLKGNIRLVADTTPYRVTKVRILNGLHTSMVMLGYLIGLESVKQCVEHPDLGQFLSDVADKEIIPVLDLPESELKQFRQDTFDRFHNPSIHHRLLSIAVNSSAKVRNRIVPSIKTYYQKHQVLPTRLVLALAAFIRFYKGEWNHHTIPLQDEAAALQFFNDIWGDNRTSSQRVEAALGNTALWDDDLNQIPGLHPLMTSYLERMNTDGLLPIIQRLNGTPT